MNPQMNATTMNLEPMPFDETLDLRLTRDVAATPAQLWEAWTNPEHLKQWFAPKPVRVTEAEIDPRPGGRFRTVMALPDGTEMAGEGCVLAAEPERRLMWTDALSRGWRPNAEPFMTAEITMEPIDGGTRYTALVLHKDAADRTRHEEMGFHDGWGTVLTQLEEFARKL